MPIHLFFLGGVIIFLIGASCTLEMSLYLVIYVANSFLFFFNFRFDFVLLLYNKVACVSGHLKCKESFLRSFSFPEFLILRDCLLRDHLHVV